MTIGLKIMATIISVVGKSNSGKTTFIENLIPKIKSHGYTVGVVKHSHHCIEIDKEGKDSWRHQKAGADTVIVSSSGSLVMVKQVKTEVGIDDLAEYFSDVDLVITEGYKRGDKPKIEVFMTDAHESPFCLGNDDLVALVTDAELVTDVPLFSLNNYEDVAVFIIKRFLRGNGKEFSTE